MNQEKSYHEILRSALEKSPLTNREVAERAGIHATYLSKLVKPGAAPASDLINESLERVLGINDSVLRVSAYKFAIPPELMPILVDDFYTKNSIFPPEPYRQKPIEKRQQALSRADRKIRRLDQFFCKKKHAGEIPMDQIQLQLCAECKVEKSKQAANVQAMKAVSDRK